MTLKPEDQDIINRFNDFAGDTTDETLKASLPMWFSNIRELIKANFKLQDIARLGEHHLARARRFVILGSGPSAPRILESLPYAPDVALIAGSTAVSACLVAGRTPDLVFVADAKPEQYTVIRDLEIEDPKLWKIALPITASPLWYSEDSIFAREQLYFYVSYLNHFGSVDLAYNHIQKFLCPDVEHYLSQSGSVSNAALTFASMLCGKDPSKRIYLGVDCCGWLTDPPIMRAPDAMKTPTCDYEPVTTFRQVRQNAEESVDALRIAHQGFDLQVNLNSLGYAVQMLLLIYSDSQGELSNRYRIIEESSFLFSALNDSKGEELILPLARACEIGLGYEPFSSEDWSYKLLLKFAEVLANHREKIIWGVKELADAEEPIENEHSEG